MLAELLLKESLALKKIRTHGTLSGALSPYVIT